MKILIKKGRVIDPASEIDNIQDILIVDNIIEKIQDHIEEKVDKIIDAEGFWVTPGLVDLHVHLREPGFEYKETIETGSLSAARGGFTTICCMPNTRPVIDCREVVDFIRMQSKKALVNILPVGAITKEQKGKELTFMNVLKEAGICALSEDGRTVQNGTLMLEAMEQAVDLNLPIFSHCEDETMVKKGASMNEGAVAKALDLVGIPPEAEEVIVARDIILAKGTGAKLHLCHVSTKGSVDIIRDAKKKGQKITAEACPHHFTLTEEDVIGLDTNTKMNPPLRKKEDVIALKEALKDNIIEVIATDHAPHHASEKGQPYSRAPFGIIGLETAVPLAMTELVGKGWLSPKELIAKLTINPAKVLGIDKGRIEPGKIADVTIINPNVEYKIDINKFKSKSKNSPFHGRRVKGRVEYTMVSGKIVYDRGKEDRE